MVTNQHRKELRPMIKKVATILKYSSEEGLYTQIEKRIKLAQLARQIRNMRRVTFSIMVVITLFVSI